VRPTGVARHGHLFERIGRLSEGITTTASCLLQFDDPSRDNRSAASAKRSPGDAGGIAMPERVANGGDGENAIQSKD